MLFTQPRLETWTALAHVVIPGSLGEVQVMTSGKPLEGKEEDLKTISCSTDSLVMDWAICNDGDDARRLNCLLFSTPMWRITGKLRMSASSEESWALMKG